MDADARSYKGSIVDDNAIIRINLKWLIQLLVVVSAAVYGYVQIEIRIRSLETSLTEANTTITELVEKHILEEQERYNEMEEELKWHQKLLKKKKK
jgi:hypothetical protein